jgi:hypothetical protein
MIKTWHPAVNVCLRDGFTVRRLQFPSVSPYALNVADLRKQCQSVSTHVALCSVSVTTS